MEAKRHCVHVHAHMLYAWRARPLNHVRALDSRASYHSSQFAELWRGFVLTPVCEAIMVARIYGRLVLVRSCLVNARTETLLIHRL